MNHMNAATLIVCETCGYDAQQPDAVRPGAQLAQVLEHELGARPQPGLTLRRTRCLMACKRHCAVLLRAPNKIGYVIGDFAPVPESARTLLDYSRHYQQSDSGQVPFRDWPDGIKGHFIARIPVLDD